MILAAAVPAAQVIGRLIGFDVRLLALQLALVRQTGADLREHDALGRRREVNPTFVAASGTVEARTVDEQLRGQHVDIRTRVGGVEIDRLSVGERGAQHEGADVIRGVGQRQPSRGTGIEQDDFGTEPCVAQGCGEDEIDRSAVAAAFVDGHVRRVLWGEPVGSVPCDARLDEFEDGVQPLAFVGVSCHDAGHFVLERVADVGIAAELRPFERLVDVVPGLGEILVNAAGNGQAVDFEFEPCAEVVEIPDVGLSPERRNPIDRAGVFGDGVAGAVIAGHHAVVERLLDGQRQIPFRADVMGEIFGDRDLRRAAYDGNGVLNADVGDRPDEVGDEGVAVLDDGAGFHVGDRELQPCRVLVDRLFEDVLLGELRLDRLAVHKVVGGAAERRDTVSFDSWRW